MSDCGALGTGANHAMCRICFPATFLNDSLESPAISQSRTAQAQWIVGLQIAIFQACEKLFAVRMRQQSAPTVPPTPVANGATTRGATRMKALMKLSTAGRGTTMSSDTNEPAAATSAAFGAF